MHFSSSVQPLHPQAIALFEAHFLADPSNLLTAFERAQLDFKTYIEQTGWPVGFENAKFLEGCPGFDNNHRLLPSAKMISRLYELARKSAYSIMSEATSAFENMAKQGIIDPNEDITNPDVVRNRSAQWLFALFLDNWLDRVSCSDLSVYFDQFDPRTIDGIDTIETVAGFQRALARQIKKRPKLQEWLELKLAYLDANAETFPSLHECIK